MTDATIDWYDANADAFAAEIEGLDLGAVYESFLPRLPSGGMILDAGCGTGRDALHFLRTGYEVVAFDASRRMVERTAQLIGGRVWLMAFEDLRMDAEFDGVWACASLLHVPCREMDATLGRLIDALKPGGTLYLSFKYGLREETRRGRLFSDYDEEALRALLERMPDLEIREIWICGDLRRDRGDERWINAIATRGTPADRSMRVTTR